MSSYNFDTSERDQIARRESYKWILGHLSRSKIKFFIMIFGTLGTNVLRIAIPFLVGVMIDQAIIPRDKGQLTFYTILILTLGIFRIALSYLTIYVTNSISWDSIRDIRVEFFTKLQDKPLEFHNRVRSGDLMALATNDMQQLGFMINPGIRLVSDAFIGLAAVVILALTIDPIFTLILTPFFILYLLSIRNYNRGMKPISQTFQHKWSLISRSAQDSITGVRVVRAFNGEEYEKKQFLDVVTDFKKTWYKQQMLVAKYWPLLIIYFTIGFSFLAGVWFVTEGYLSLGELVSINGMLLLMILPTFIISFAVGMLQGGLAGGERIFHTMNAYDSEEAIETTFLDWPEKVEGKIEFNDVNFKYEGTDKYVLQKINLEIESGETVALVGPTGSGKTTLTKLLSRFYLYEGFITLDGTDIQDFQLQDLRQNIGRVEQDIFLFASTIKENIMFGIGNRQVSQDEIELTAKTAQAHDFISKQVDGYDTLLGERGVGLSGGQRQRLAIARCLLTDPKILILDDSTSAIDSETEERISLAMNEVMKNRTTLLITHRLSAIRKADKIVVLKDGSIKAIGKHDDLISTSEDYRRIFSKHIDLPPISDGGK